MDAAPTDRARRMIAAADRIVVLTGAGISAESGVPTFRGEGGLWKSYRPEELATPQAFARDARLVWEWYGWRRELISRCAPNDGHVALARLARSRDGVRIVTQNVDGLHQLAGHRLAGEGSAQGRPPLELHGSLFRVRCVACRHRAEHREPIDATRDSTLPRCPACGALLRPDVVWFGEPLDEAVLSAALEAAADAQVCLVVGTSAVVHPAATIPRVTAQSGGDIIEVNPEPTPLSDVASAVLRGPAGVLLPQVLEDPPSMASASEPPL